MVRRILILALIRITTAITIVILTRRMWLRMALTAIHLTRFTTLIVMVRVTAIIRTIQLTQLIPAQLYTLQVEQYKRRHSKLAPVQVVLMAHLLGSVQLTIQNIVYQTGLAAS